VENNVAVEDKGVRSGDHSWANHRHGVTVLPLPRHPPGTKQLLHWRPAPTRLHFELKGAAARVVLLLVPILRLHPRIIRQVLSSPKSCLLLPPPPASSCLLQGSLSSLFCILALWHSISSFSGQNSASTLPARSTSFTSPSAGFSTGFPPLPCGGL